MFRDLRTLIPIFGEHEYVEGFLDMLYKFFPYRDAWVENMQIVWDQV